MRYVIISFFLFFSLLFSCSTKIDKELRVQQKKADLYYSNGTNLLVKKKYLKAIIKLKKANKLRPNDSKILNNLGLAYLLKGYPSKATGYLRKSIKINPNNLDAKINLAGLFLETNQYYKAKRLYLKISKVIEYEKQTKTYYNLALIEKKLHKTHSMLKFLKLSLKEDRRYCPSHYLLSLYYLGRKKYKTALKQAFLSGNGECYQDPNPLLLQARIYRLMNKLQDSYKKYQVVLRRFPQTKEGTRASRGINYLLRIDPNLSVITLDANRNKLLNGISI